MARLFASPVGTPLTGGPCFCCRRRDEGVGAIVSGPRIVWSCNDHITLAMKAIAMPQRDFDIYEKRSIEAAGAVAGRMLDEQFGTTDLAVLEPHQWVKFCETLINEFGKNLAARLSDSNETPF